MPVKGHMHRALGFVAFAALAGLGCGVHAAQLEVTATLPDSCRVDSGIVAFGEVDPSSGDTQPISTTFNLQCSLNGSVNVALDGGLYPDKSTTTNRAMKRAGSEDYLDYTLKTDSNFEWPVNIGVVQSVQAGPNPIGVKGSIPQQMKLGGEYADIVQITLTIN